MVTFDLGGNGIAYRAGMLVNIQFQIDYKTIFLMVDIDFLIFARSRPKTVKKSLSCKEESTAIENTILRSKKNKKSK